MSWSEAFSIWPNYVFYWGQSLEGDPCWNLCHTETITFDLVREVGGEKNLEKFWRLVGNWRDVSISFKCFDQSSTGIFFIITFLDLNTNKHIFALVFHFSPDAPKTPIVSTDSSQSDHVILTCHSDANPAASYSWFKGNQPLYRYQPQLTIQLNQSANFTEYHCRAENLLGESTSCPIKHEKLNIDISCK